MMFEIFFNEGFYGSRRANLVRHFLRIFAIRDPTQITSGFAACLFQRYDVGPTEDALGLVGRDADIGWVRSLNGPPITPS